MRTDDKTLIESMRILARDMWSTDGIANAAIAEAADRIEELTASIKQIHKDYGCELRDPNGTIWDHAAKLQEENERLRERVEQLEKSITPDGMEQALEHLRGDKEHFRGILLNKNELLRCMCDYAESVAKKKRLEPWSIISDMTSHGSGVSSAIYELYRRK